MKATALTAYKCQINTPSLSFESRDYHLEKEGAKADAQHVMDRYFVRADISPDEPAYNVQSVTFSEIQIKK